MDNEFEITREIGIDVGHRVTYHGSKCRNLHGHRYTVQATCRGPLEKAGASQGMVLDFGFLKEEMMKHIDEICDHGTVLWWRDPLVQLFTDFPGPGKTEQDPPPLLTAGRGGKLYLVPFVPTAENLARHWFDLMIEPVRQRSEGKARMHRLRVYETPNCWADYPTT